MSVNVLNIIAAKQLEASQESQYTVPPSTKTIIDKFTVTNTSVNPVTFSVNIIPLGGSAANDNKILDEVTVPANDYYPCPELIGHVLHAGSFISTIAGAATSLTVLADGREIT